MKTYLVMTYESRLTEYSVVANSESEARELVINSDHPVVSEKCTDWDIVDVAEREQ